MNFQIDNQYDYYNNSLDDFEGYEDNFIFTNYCIDLEYAVNSNSKIKELLNNDRELISTFNSIFFNSSHLMTIMQLRPLVDTVIYALIYNLKYELDNFIKTSEALLGSRYSHHNLNYLHPAIVIDAIKIKFKIGAEEVRVACERAMKKLIIEHD